MGLYGYRLGCFSWVSASKEEADRVMPAVKKICRNTWSNPPKFGSCIAKRILRNPVYKA
jgi:aspartate aminotransferase